MSSPFILLSKIIVDSREVRELIQENFGDHLRYQHSDEIYTPSATTAGSFVAVKVGLNGTKSRVEKKTDLIPEMIATADEVKYQLTEQRAFCQQTQVNNEHRFTVVESRLETISE